MLHLQQKPRNKGKRTRKQVSPPIPERDQHYGQDYPHHRKSNILVPKLHTQANNFNVSNIHVKLQSKSNLGHTINYPFYLIQKLYML